MPKRATSLVPPASQLQRLSEAMAERVIQAVDRENQRAHYYAFLGMICGTASFLACVVSFSYLVVNGHPAAAGVVLGTGVRAIVGRMIAARL